MAKNSTTTFVSNQPLYFVDSYWVQGVGNIKNITSPAKFKAEIDISADQEMNPISEDCDQPGGDKGLCVKPTDPNCTQIPQSVKLSMKFKGGKRLGKIEIPLVLEKRSFIQDLKKYTFRETTN